MKWIFVLAWLCTPIVQAAGVYKCTTTDGRVIFSSSGCGTESGSAERQDLKINNMGASVKPPSIEIKNTQTPVPNVIYNSADDDTREGRVKKRLRAQEEYLDRLKTKTPGITVIKESTDETNHDKKKRLREEAQELYYKQ
ncbi:DUF4124 domain-containing protein [Pseudomonas frederiksbergensis]|uniref:DUF4124 domain-containing protein n=1 Tax=Pseudomonas frederiksbergensis TaxID=104087 RepID=UPI003D24C0E4